MILALIVACGTGTINLDGAPHQGDSVVSGNDSVVSDDKDGDGYDLDEDCNDADPDIHPGAAEIWYDGIDQDCAGDGGFLDYDQDGDGVLSWQYGADLGGTDCDDDGDGRWVNNCNGNGANYGEYADCDDADPQRSPSNPEDNNNGIDDNCLGGIDGFGLTVWWDVTEDEVSHEYVGTLTVLVTDDYIFELSILVNNPPMKVELRNTSEDDAVFYGEIAVVASDEYQSGRTMEITLNGHAPEEVSFLYLSQNGVSALGEYTNDRNTPNDTTDDLQLPVSCAVWGPEANLFTVDLDGPCVDISTPGTAPDGSSYDGITNDGSGDWTWNGR